MASVPLGKAVAWIDGALDVKSFRDNSNNGLQIDAGRGEVSKIAFGVDASVRFLEAAAAAVFAAALYEKLGFEKAKYYSFYRKV